MGPYNLGMFFEDIATRSANNNVLVYGDMRHSYKNLNDLADRYVYFLYENDVVPGDVVAIVNTKEFESFAMMVSCLKIGAAYTNLDPDNPLPRTDAILETCRPMFLFTDQIPVHGLSDICRNRDIKLVELKSINATEGKKLPAGSLEKVTGARIAYIMFTSGSTGTPKGVAISHQNVIHFIRWSISRYEITDGDVFANVSPLYFDNSVFDFYTALFSGAALAPIKKELLNSPLQLLNYLDENKCSIWFSVPSLLIYLHVMKALNPESFSTFRVISFGGEGFPKTELLKLYDLYKDRITFINVYGPTEGTCICSSHTITEDTFADMEGYPTLGTINSNFDYLILDDDNSVAEKGELCILGPNIGLGYYNDPEKTKSVFSYHYENGFYGTPMYKTGDIVYKQDDLLYFIGRKDNQIKHMGYRVELEEIDRALNKIMGINQAATIYYRESDTHGKIIAYYSSEVVIAAQKIIEELQKTLPQYMVPNKIIHLPALPKNPNGKVDRKALLERASK